MATAQSNFASFTTGDYGISVNVPEDTASGSSQTIYMQIHGPSDAAWIGFGQGSRMAGSNMFIVYTDGSGNVTVSPRTGTGHFEPEFNSDAQITVLEGSGVDSSGSIIANIRCDSCLSWSGGSMDATDSSSSWIWAHASGSSLDTTDTSATIRQHSSEGSFSLDLTTGTGGTSANPFIAATNTDDAASPSQSASEPASGTATNSPSSTPSATRGVNAPIASSGSDSNRGSSITTDNTLSLRKTHGIIMSITFVVLFPLAALAMYLPFAKRALFVHAPLQTIGVILMIVGLATGVILGNRVSELDGYHQVIGYIIVAVLILAQPALGLLQHMYFRRHGGRSIKGIAHQWIGRSFILLGVINGGLGFNITGPTGSQYVPRGAVIAYGVIAGLVGVLYIAVVVFMGRRGGRNGTSSPRGGEKRTDRFFETEMQPQSSPSDRAWEPQGQAHGNQKKYTINGRQ